MVIEVVLLAVGTAATVAMAVVGWKHYQNSRSTSPSVTNHDTRTYQRMDASTRVGPIVLMPSPPPAQASLPPRQLPPEDSPASRPSPVSKKPAPRRVSEFVVEEIVEYLEVESGSYSEFSCELNEGDELKGIVREQDGFEFDFYIMDEENYAAFSEDQEWEGIHVSENVANHRINTSIPHDDTWYFVAEIYGKQNTREIDVSIRRRTIA